MERRLVDLERRMDPRGQTLENPIVIESDNEVTFLEGPRVVRELIHLDDK